MIPSPFSHAADLLDPPANPYRDDPSGWASDRLGLYLWSKQREIARSVADHRYTAVHSCHDAGKSFVSSVLAAWWLDSHPAGSAFVVTTAPTFPQVRAILWREIGKLHRLGDLPGRVNQTEWHIGDEIVAYGRKPADYDQAAFQGIHARYVLVIVDEACGVPKSLFDAVDALVTNEDCRVLAIGNPDDPAAHFATVCGPNSGWNVVHIDGYDTPNFTDEQVPDDLRPLLLSPTWVEERRQRWGESSPLYTAKVRGVFPDDTQDSVIPLSWVRAAQRRWTEREAPIPPLTCVGVDVARTGADHNAAALRHGVRIERIDTWSDADTMTTVGRVNQLAANVPAVIDVIGIGAGVVDRRVEQGLATEPFNASERTVLTDSSGTLGFVNKRSAAWWGLRELLDPDSGWDIELPDDDELAAELTAPKWQPTSAGRVKVEAKDDIRKRLGRSTDLADAVIQAFWPGEPDKSGTVEWHDPVTIGVDL